MKILQSLLKTFGSFRKVASSKAFMKEYIGDEKEQKGIPGFTMNAPVVRPNGKADIGIEIEVEGRNLPTQGYFNEEKSLKSGTRWIVKEDGSLRNGGREYVLENPCFPDEVRPLLEKLWDSFAKARTTLQISNRCSTHVHINQSGRKINHLTSTVALWSMFEEILINWCGEERKTNHFCLSGRDTYSLVENWNATLRRGNFQFSDGYKYLALNVRPLWTFGSLEFRTMRADERLEPILDWALFVYGMCKYAADRYENPSRIANDISERSGREIFIDICKEYGVSNNFIDEVFSHSDNLDADRQILNGFRTAQPLLMEHPWDDWVELINKPFIPSPFGEKAKKNKFFGMQDQGLRDAAELIRLAERHRPRAARLANAEYDRYRIDPTIPVEFTDGTPAEVHPASRERGLASISVRSRALRTHFFEGASRQTDLREWFSYNANTGWWSGDPSRGRIRNVGALPNNEDNDFIPMPILDDAEE